MSKTPRVIAIILMVVGGIFIVAGSVTYYLVHRELADENIVVSEDAATMAGKEVRGPFTAYSQAMVIKEHALDMADGQTYAELPRDDPRRESVMDASFLRASLFTSVVAFGVAALVVALGVLFILVGVAINSMHRKLAQNLGVVIYQSDDAPVADPSPDATPPQAGQVPKMPTADKDPISVGGVITDAKQAEYKVRSSKARFDMFRRQLPK